MDLKNILTDDKLHLLRKIMVSLGHYRNFISKEWRGADELIKDIDKLTKEE